MTTRSPQLRQDSDRTRMLLRLQRWDVEQYASLGGRVDVALLTENDPRASEAVDHVRAQARYAQILAALDKAVADPDPGRG